MPRNDNRPIRKLSTADVKITTDVVRCLLTNATSNLPQYSSPEYRLHNIQDAISKLQVLERMLAAEAAMQKMVQSA